MNDGLKKNVFFDFISNEKIGGILLLISTVSSVLIANSFMGQAFYRFIHSEFNLSLPGFFLDYSIQHWINEGLMTLFFLMVGLEIERELYVGELSIIKNALLPILAALGGMVVPSAIYLCLNYRTGTITGFGVPMATDIAFSLAILSLLSNKIPTSIKIFLTAFAIIDDLGAIVIIAIFYSKNISLIYLLLSIVVYVILLIFNRKKVFYIWPYITLGLIMWYLMAKSGIHPTITGVLLAFAIPFKKDGVNPSYKIQLALHKPVSLIILPIFAMANTCIQISSVNLIDLFSLNSIGIFLGLVVGKPIGIFLFSFVSIMLGVCQYPTDATYKHILGAGFLGGIGFTMSIFIANLAFSDSNIINGSILVILLASVLSAIMGFTYFSMLKLRTGTSFSQLK